MKNKFTANEISRILKEFASGIDNEVAVLARTKPGNELTANELNTFVESFGFNSIGDQWILVNREQAHRILETLIYWFDQYYPGDHEREQLHKNLCNSFLDNFSKDAHYFTSAVPFRIEYADSSHDESETEYVNRPFVSNQPVKKFIRGFSPFYRRESDGCLGIVTLDRENIGLFFVEHR